MRSKSDLGYCLKNGVSVYPIRQQRDVYKDKELLLQKGHWYVQVNNNGNLKTYPKSLGVGLKLTGKQIGDAIEKTITFWANKIESSKTK